MSMNTSANFLFVMDPLETLNLETETSLLLMQELIARGQGAYWLQQEDVALVHDQPMGRPASQGRIRWHLQSLAGGI